MDEQLNGLMQHFDHSKTIHRHMQMGFAQFVNQHGRIPEYLSLYLDEKICKGMKEVRLRHKQITTESI